MHDDRASGNGRRAALAGVIVCLLVLAVPLQYLVRREVVVGLPSDSAHSHAHDAGEQEHAHEHSDEGEGEHEHEHTCEAGHLGTDVPLGVNLIPNYGFEVGTRERVWGWLRIADDQGAVAYRDERVSRRGLASAAVHAGDGQVQGAGWITRLDELPLDHDVIIEGYVRTELLQGEAYLAAAYEVEGEEGALEGVAAYTAGVGGNSDWTLVSARCYVPPEAQVVYLLAQVFGEGRAWFDDFSLRVEEKGDTET